MLQRVLQEEGYGIINVDGDLWKAQRKAGVSFLSGSNVRSIIEGVLPKSYEVTRRQLLALADNGAVGDLQAVMLDLTTRVFGNVAYDVCFLYPIPKRSS